MRNIHHPIWLYWIGMLFLASCQNAATTPSTTAPEVTIPKTLEQIVQTAQEKYRPDKRVALLSYNYENDTLFVETNLVEAKSQLQQELEATGKAFQIKFLPDSEELEEKTYAIVRVSVANLRSKRGHSKEMATQATLGMIVKVLKEERGWYLIQTPDNYIAWALNHHITNITEEQMLAYQEKPRVIFTAVDGISYEEADVNSARVSDLVFGNVLELLEKQDNFTKIKYPDGREAFVKDSDIQPLTNWVDGTKISENKLIKSAKTLLGTPYLWGGTSSKGLDCSGFTKTVYAMNGIMIPRDASQQVHEGMEVATSSADFDKLQTGDLLFFGSKTDAGKEKVVHVGMWLGNQEFIHASGMVRVSSMDSLAPNYDEFERNRFLRAKRFMNETSAGIQPMQNAF